MGQGLPHFMVDKLGTFPQLISNEVSDCTPNIWWICSHVFELGDLQLLERSQSFTTDKGFLPITLLIGMLYCLFFKTWKAIDSLTCVPNFLFGDVYLNLLFDVKLGPSLDLSCLMSSMFIIILIIRIIKTTRFNNTALTAKSERKLP